MACWLTTIYTCGHEIVTRTHKRDRTWRPGKPCASCQRQIDTERARHEAENAGLPALRGVSQAQRDYGERERRRLLAELDQRIKRMSLVAFSDDERTLVDGVREVRQQIAREHTEAAWWIDRPDVLPDLLPVDAKAAMERLLRHQEATLAESRRLAEEEAARWAEVRAREVAAEEAASRARAEEEERYSSTLAGVTVVSVYDAGQGNWRATLSDGRVVLGYDDHGNWGAYAVATDSDSEPIGISGEHAQRIAEVVKHILTLA